MSKPPPMSAPDGRGFFSRCGEFIADLFKGPGNRYWDLGRILGFCSALALIAGAIWNMKLGKEIDLGPSGFGGGLAAVVAAIAGLIAAKDYVGKIKGE